MNHVGKNLALLFTVLMLGKPVVMNAQNKIKPADSIQSISKVSIDGTYEPPGESVDVIFSSEGFMAKIPGEFVDHWKRVR